MTQTIYAAALAWAEADRAADDRAADVTGIERVIAQADRPVPVSLLNDRDAAVMALRDACKVEGAAEEEMREAARALIDRRDAEAAWKAES